MPNEVRTRVPPLCRQRSKIANGNPRLHLPFTITTALVRETRLPFVARFYRLVLQKFSVATTTKTSICSMPRIRMVPMRSIAIVGTAIVIRVSGSLTLTNCGSDAFIRRLVKSVNFYGQNSEYVISGSDCGHVFIWDKCSETCVWFDKGDEDGTVNVLEPHPHFPIIATSGLEHDVKIWQPLSAETVDLKRLKSVGEHSSNPIES